MIPGSLPLRPQPPSASVNVRAAAVQMLARPAPLQDRLARAGNLVAQAAREGARLVVLPELFNTGYEYSDENYARSEPLDGPTASWMKAVAARFHLHLAGTFLRREGQDIYNTLLLVAPDSRTWLYDKTCPWMWERAYFRGGKGPVLADTELGRIGLLVCWDIAHPALWQRYAGQVHLMLASSCPPRGHELALVLPDGGRVAFADIGPFTRRIQRTSSGTFGPLLRRQSAALGVPVVHASAAGTFRSAFPSPRLVLVTLALTCPRLWRWLPQADRLPQAGRVLLEAGYFDESYLADAGGRLLACVPPETEACALADLVLPASPPPPRSPQPDFGISRFAYWFDAFANAVLRWEYQRKVNDDK